MAEPEPTAYAGHATYSAGKLRGDDGVNLAPADRGDDYDPTDFFEGQDPSPGAAAWLNGYPRQG